MKNSNCPVCATGNLVEHNELDAINYKNQSLSVEIEYSVCTKCEEEMILPDQIKRNDCRIRDAWRKADGMLTGIEIKALREQLHLTQKEAASLFGGGTNAFSKYERGEVIQSESMDKLMRLALEKQPIVVLDWLSTHYGIQTGRTGQYGNIIKFKSKKVDSEFEMIDFNDVRYG